MGGTMNDDTTMREQMSALADGQLSGEELGRAVSMACQDEEARATWQTYHLIGDVLRSSDLARMPDTVLVDRIRSQLAQEPSRPVVAPLAQPVVMEARESANASVFRWKMAAGFASLAAVAAIGWSAATGLSGGPTAGPQLAAAPAQPAQPSAPVVAVANPEGAQVMLRDPRLDELLAAHKQFGNTSALQMPAGFLRNATFDSSGR